MKVGSVRSYFFSSIAYLSSLRSVFYALYTKFVYFWS